MRSTTTALYDGADLIRPGSLSILDGLTSVGKSTLCRQIASIQGARRPVYFACLASTVRDFSEHLACTAAGVAYAKWQSEELSREECERLREGIRHVRSLNISLAATPDLALETLKETYSTLLGGKVAPLLIVDPLSYLKDGDCPENVAGLKALAAGSKSAVIAVRHTPSHPGYRTRPKENGITQATLWGDGILAIRSGPFGSVQAIPLTFDKPVGHFYTQ